MYAIKGLFDENRLKRSENLARLFDILDKTGIAVDKNRLSDILTTLTDSEEARSLFNSPFYSGNKSKDVTKAFEHARFQLESAKSTAAPVLMKNHVLETRKLQNNRLFVGTDALTEDAMFSVSGSKDINAGIYKVKTINTGKNTGMARLQLEEISTVNPNGTGKMVNLYRSDLRGIQDLLDGTNAKWLAKTAMEEPNGLMMKAIATAEKDIALSVQKQLNAQARRSFSEMNRFLVDDGTMVGKGSAAMIGFNKAQEAIDPQTKRFYGQVQALMNSGHIPRAKIQVESRALVNEFNNAILEQGSVTKEFGDNLIGQVYRGYMGKASASFDLQSRVDDLAAQGADLIRKQTEGKSTVQRIADNRVDMNHVTLQVREATDHYISQIEDRHIGIKGSQEQTERFIRRKMGSQLAKYDDMNKTAQIGLENNFINMIANGNDATLKSIGWGSESSLGSTIVPLGSNTGKKFSDLSISELNSIIDEDMVGANGRVVNGDIAQRYRTRINDYLAEVDDMNGRRTMTTAAPLNMPDVRAGMVDNIDDMFAYGSSVMKKQKSGMTTKIVGTVTDGLKANSGVIGSVAAGMAILATASILQQKTALGSSVTPEAVPATETAPAPSSMYQNVHPIANAATKIPALGGNTVYSDPNGQQQGMRITINGTAKAGTNPED
ncbi:MAG: hypothetical protein ACQ5SW_12940, partial [Sphaerochaetaceae bacterium]